MTEERNVPNAPGPDDLAAAKRKMAAVGESIAEKAANLREAIKAGTVPPKATAQLAEQLEQIAARMRPEETSDTGIDE